MKRSMFIYCIMLVAALAASSCVRDITPALPSGGPTLSVCPSIFRGEDIAVTKVLDTDSGIQAGDEVDARDELRENFFGNLDIFVKRQSDAPGSAWFKEYHLKAGDAGVIVDNTRYNSESLLDQAKQALASNWAEQGFEPGVPYDIYVTANNPHTLAASAPANLTALKSLTTSSYDIYRYWLNYEPSQTDPVYSTNAMWSEEKSFLMDGSIEGWTIDPDSAEQVFDVDLKRAAAKIIVNVSFSDEDTMLKVAEATTANPNPTPVLDSEGRAVYCNMQEYMQYVGRTVGEPRWKHVNFNLSCADIADSGSTVPSAGELDTYDSNFATTVIGNSTDNTENSFTFTTYTYPVDWSSDSSRIPYILLSVFYTRTSDADQLRSYYRIPVCDESAVTSLERNNIYIVDAKIGSLGASNESFEAQDEELRIEYHVIPWTETNMSQEATTVKIRDTKYLTVLPTEYTLKGDGTQSVELQWYASVSTDDKRFVDIDPSSLQVTYINYLGTTTDIKGTVNKKVRNDAGTLVTATDANTDGKRDIVIESTAPSGTNAAASGETVTLTITPRGLLIVQSEALKSRAVKDISFTVYLKNASGVDPVTVTIRHFPLDNIQSIAGEWSSRWDGVKANREYSFNPEADGWGSPSLYPYEEGIECTAAQYASAVAGKYTDIQNDGTPSDHVDTDYRVNYTTGTNNSTVQTQYRNNVSQGVNRYNTNGEANAALGADGYWYWGDTRTNGSTNNYDWRGETAGGTGTRYRWTNYHRSQFKKTHYYARGYYKEVAVTVPSTGSWVEWGGSDGTTNEGIFTAKVYYNGKCYAISDHDSRGSGYDQLTNNHMYVVQITSTSNKYVLGRPVLDSNYQSQDKVVSPAFMIASQLGAVSRTNSSTTASTHCGTYMEVGEDGTRYVGWRLPTKQEITVIIDYQSGEHTNKVTMEEVLGGQYYWALDGTSAYVSTGSEGTSTNAYVRCVRDMTLAEINKLNQAGN